MKSISRNISEFIGSIVSKVDLGEGTFLNLFSEKGKDNFQLWIYLSNWAVTLNDNEIISSDNYFDLKKFEFNKLFFNNTCIDIIIVDYEEIKFKFSGGINIEIWANVEEYGLDASLFYIFKNDINICDAKAHFDIN